MFPKLAALPLLAGGLTDINWMLSLFTIILFLMFVGVLSKFAWGPLLKAGPESSSFGHQVEAYSCLYTGRVSNFLGYSPIHFFRSPREHLPHEL